MSQLYEAISKIKVLHTGVSASWYVFILWYYLQTRLMVLCIMCKAQLIALVQVMIILFT